MTPVEKRKRLADALRYAASLVEKLNPGTSFYIHMNDTNSAGNLGQFEVYPKTKEEYEAVAAILNRRVAEGEGEVTKVVGFIEVAVVAPGDDDDILTRLEFGDGEEEGR